MLVELLTTDVFVFVTIFARLGAALMLIPPFGDVFVLRRTRLALALTMSFVLMPLAGSTMPPMPAGPLELALIVGGEVAIGVFIGGLTRILFSGLHTASMVVAYQIGLGAAIAFAPAQDDQSVMVGRFFTLIALVLMFATEMHQVLLLALVDSYRALPPGGLPPADSFALQAVNFIAAAFVAALQVAAPVLVIGLMFWIGLGLLARLMPGMQVFFVALPLQIALGFWVIMISLSGMMLWFFEFFEDRVTVMLAIG